MDERSSSPGEAGGDLLLAKSLSRGHPPVTLGQHLLVTEVAALSIFRDGSRLLTRWLDFFKLPQEAAPTFLLHLRLAALLHDLGKANDDFQGMIRGTHNVQALRHEHLSALILRMPAVQDWLGQNGKLDRDILTAAVLSHHVKATFERSEWAWGQARRAGPVTLRLDHPDVLHVLARVSAMLGLPQAPALPSRWSPGAPWDEIVRRAIRDSNTFRRDCARDTLRRGLCLAVKAGIVAADTAASGLVRENHPVEEWIEEALHGPALTPANLDTAILQPRIQAIEKAVGDGHAFTFQDFQLGVARTDRRTLLLAPCGSGKTLAAWKWIQARLAERPLGRAIFLYPTRGTATEGFRDYVAAAPEAEAALIHGTARFELESMLENPPESWKDRLRGDDLPDPRLFSVGFWPRRFFSATVDQFLAFLEHRYESLCLLPALADCALVIDEVHSFDARMFSALVAFLRDFDLPVLCMTATLPPERQRQLEALGLEVYPDRHDLVRLANLEEQARHPRYRVQRLALPEEAIARAAAAANEGRRVLWVTNVVERAQRYADELEALCGREVLCYHSRYRLCDRQRIHRAAVDAFRDPREPALVVATQVCEMSLDIDADLLVTEIAPLPSLVQRFGRANRHRVRGDDFRAEILLIPAPTTVPYTKEDLVWVEPFCQAVEGRDVSQRQLAELLEQLSPAQCWVEGSAGFLTGGWFAIERSFRDSDDYSVPCVLDADVPEVVELLRVRSPEDGFVLPVPRRFATQPVDVPRKWPRHLRIAPSERYSCNRGFCSAHRGGEA